MTNAIDYARLNILWAAPEHAGEIGELHAGLFDKAWDAQSIARLLEHPGSIAFLARLGDPMQTVGFILSLLAADEAEILTLGVHKDRQRRQIGRRLVEAMARAAKKAEARRLFLEVSEANKAALALYRRLGFLEVGRRKGYYERPGSPPEDALTLALAL